MRVDELRRALHERADVVGSGDVHGRVLSVHRRVGVTRRRRALGVGAAAAAVVAAVGLSVVPPLLDHRPAPTDHDTPAKLAGRTVPATQTATGYRFDYARGLESRPGQKRLTLTLPGSDRPRLVMWASSADGRRPTVTVTDSNDTVARSAAGDFDRYLFVPSGDDRVVLTQRDAGPRTRLALATYTLSPTPPPGVTNGEVTYRGHVLDDPLLGARIGARGRTDVVLRVTVPADGKLWLSPLCYGSTHTYRVTVGTRELVDGPCDQQPPFDPATAGAVRAPLGRPGQSIELGVHLDALPGRLGEVVDPGVVLGVAAYADRAATVDVAGKRVPERYERGGHEYAAGEWASTRPGGRDVTIWADSSDRPRAVTLVGTGLATSGSRLVLLADGEPVLWQEEDPSGSSQSGFDYVLQPGDTPKLVLRVARGLTPRTRVGVVFSDLVH